MDKILILNRIKEEKKFHTDLELADFLGIKQSTLASWRSRNTLDYELIIAKCNDIDLNWLITGEGSMYKNQNNNIALEIELEKLRAENKVLRKYLPSESPISIAAEKETEYEKS